MLAHVHRSARATLLVIAVGLTVASCKDKADSKATPASSQATAPTDLGLTEVDRVALMERHYNSIIKAHDSVIAGDHKAAQANLVALGGQDLSSKAPASWRPLHQAMQTAAKGATAIDDVESAGSAVAATAQACGNCHKQLGHPPLDSHKPPTPQAAGNLAAKMDSHQWATERLWDGVVGPSDAAWQRGAAVLSNSRVFTADGGTISAELLEQQSKLRALGVDAMKTSDASGRARLYGRLLATCAGCHTQVGVTIPARK